nr:hypothetical protein [Tanacetum cinerariifolium]
MATLPLDELIGNLKVYEIILASDGVSSKPIKEKVMPITLRANVTRGQTSNDSVCQDGSDEDEHKEEEFNSIVKNLWKLFKKGNRFKRENRFGNGGDSYDNKNHFIDDCPTVKMKRVLVHRAESHSKDGDQMEKDATCLMAIDSQKLDTAYEETWLCRIGKRECAFSCDVQMLIRRIFFAGYDVLNRYRQSLNIIV